MILRLYDVIDLSNRSCVYGLSSQRWRLTALGACDVTDSRCTLNTPRGVCVESSMSRSMTSHTMLLKFCSTLIGHEPKIGRLTAPWTQLRWFHDFISSLLSVKWMSDSKSAHPITLESSRARKNSANVIGTIWPQLTSVDLWRTGWPVGIMSTTWNQTCVRLWVESWVDSWVNGFCLSHELIRIHVFKKSARVRVESIQFEVAKLSHESQ